MKIGVGSPRSESSTPIESADAELSLVHRQQHDAAIRVQTTAIKGRTLLARKCWKREQQKVNVGHSRRVWWARRRDGLVLATRLCANQGLRHAHQTQNARVTNKVE